MPCQPFIMRLNSLTCLWIQKVCLPVLNHRIILSPDKEMEGFTTEDVITAIVKNIEVPR